MFSKFQIMIFFATALILGTGHPAVLAQDQNDKKEEADDGIQRIVVTAQKRQQSIQEVGIAITAFDGDTIEELGFETAEQITGMSPGVSIVQPNGPSAFFVSIRGVGQNDFSGDHQESPVAIYVDEAYISAASGGGFQLFDLERVEVLRGPQGTLFGRNATGGLVHYISKMPDDYFNGYMKISAGRFNQQQFQGAIGGPISDTVAGRFSFIRNKHDPYVKNTIGKDLNNGNDWAIRGQLLFDFENVDWLLIAKSGEQDIDSGFFGHSSARPNSVTGLGGDFNGTDLTQLQWQEPDDGIYTGSYDRIGYNIVESKSLTSKITWDFNENINLTVLTDYFNLEKDYLEDSDASPADFFNFFIQTDMEQFSQELRLSGRTDDINWVTGLYYLNIEGDFSNGGETRGFFEILGFPGTGEGGGPLGIYNPFATETTSTAIFGQLEYNLSDNVSLVAGIRVTNEEKTTHFSTYYVEFAQTSNTVVNMDVFGFGGPLFDFDVDSFANASKDDNLVTAKLQLDWQFDDNMMIYASYNRGIKAGGFNAPLDVTDLIDGNPENGTTDEMSFDEEILHAYELGFKSDLLGNKLRLNGAAYYYDYKDYQAFNFLGLTQYVFNTDAEVKGMELELQVQSSSNLELRLGVGFVDSNVEDAYRLPSGDLIDRTAVMTPEWNINGMVRYEWEMDSGALAAILDFNYMGDHHFQLKNPNLGKEDGYSLVNMRLSYTTNDNLWTVTAFVNNVFDEEYRLMAFDVSGIPEEGGFGMAQNYYGKPRWYGVSLAYSWE